VKKLFQFPASVGWRDHVVGALLATLVVTSLLLTADSLGFARDEGFYFRAAAQYARWFGVLFSDPAHAFDRAFIDRIWGYNHEHPALIKSLFALSWLGLNQKWHILRDPSDAFRFPAMVLSGIAVWVTYLFGARVYSRRAGVVAAALLFLTPRIFYHAHLACFDLPIVAMWTLCIYVYWRSIERGGIGWAVVAGLVYGLTLETKHNAWILPAVFLPHMLLLIRERLRSDLKRHVLAVPASLVAMALIGPVVFWALWPWMWFDTAARLREYFDFHFNHVYYNMEFLGTNYFEAPSPRGYMPLMLLATVPSITLLLFAIGAGSQLREAGRAGISWLRGRRSDPSPSPSTSPSTDARPSYPNVLFGLAVLASISPWLFTKTPIFGGTKHWITAYPFMALLAAHGLERALASMDTVAAKVPTWGKRGMRFAVILVVIAGPALISFHAHPFGLSSYVPFVGGTRGGARLGLNRQFWGFTTQSASEQYLAEHAPKGATVFIHDTAWDSWGRMIEEGRVRPDLRGVGAPSQAMFSIIHHELHMNEVEYQVWVAYGTRAPVFVVTHDEVPVVSIYRQP
jgi:Dolichyl-phosphate-mannose-protein mannosyltransferase